jgi:hypothetical protein
MSTNKNLMSFRCDLTVEDVEVLGEVRMAEDGRCYVDEFEINFAGEDITHLFSDRQKEDLETGLIEIYITERSN